jgi:hypothetical protein
MGVLELTGPLLLLHPDDPVAVARHDLAAGELLAGGERPLLARESIPSRHKVALRTLEEGQVVHKYGQVIGVTTRRIIAGEHVHDHNLISPSCRGALPSPGAPATRPEPSPVPRPKSTRTSIPAPPAGPGTAPTLAVSGARTAGWGPATTSRC